MKKEILNKNNTKTQNRNILHTDKSKTMQTPVNAQYHATQNAITIISLIITIIILLILAGVTISFTMGENGIFKLAKSATEKYENSAEKEDAGINELNKNIEKYGIASNRDTITIDKKEYEQLKERIEKLENRYYPNKSLDLTLDNNQVIIPKSGWLYIEFFKEPAGSVFRAFRNENSVFLVACPTVNTGSSTYIPVNEGDEIKVSGGSSYFILRLRYNE